MKYRPSPLLVWKLALIIVIAAIAILLRFDPVKAHVAKRREELPRKIEKEVIRSTSEKAGGSKPSQTARPAAATPGVDFVFFGNSLLQAALPSRQTELSGVLYRFAAKQGHRKAVRVVNLAADGRSTWDLNRRSEEILRLNPRIILIQTEMIVPRRVERREQRNVSFGKKEWDRLHNWIRFARTPLLVTIVKSPPEAGKKEVALRNSLSSQARVDIGILGNTEEEESDETILHRAEELWSNQAISTSSSEFTNSAAFIQKARERGIQILVVETPVSETAARFATAEYFDLRAATVQQVLGPKDEFLRFPENLPDDHFHDYSHVNRKGQLVFLQWLAPRLAQRLPEEN